MHFKQMISSVSPGPKYFKDEMNLKYEREYFLSGLTLFFKAFFFLSHHKDNKIGDIYKK